MKIIHTADWHLGKLLAGTYLHEDQAYILESFISLLEKEKPDVILLAGDIYDRSYPPVEAVSLLNRVFERILLDLKIPMIVITGNHDNPERLDFGSSLMEKSGLYLRAKLEKEIKPICIEKENAIWEFYPIPYADTAYIRGLYQMPEIKTAERAMQEVLRPIIEKIKAEKQMNGQKKYYVALAHTFFISGKEGEGADREYPIESDSERPLSIGGVDYISAEIMDVFDYVALGHLHQPQKIGRESMRYSGSLLKYSFSEANHHKSVVVLDWEEELKIRLEELPVKRDLRILKGKLAELLENGRQDEKREDYVLARLTDEQIQIEPIRDLRAIYPNILGLEYERKEESAGRTILQMGKELNKKDTLDLFAEFYQTATGKTPDLTSLKERALSGGKEINEAN